MKIVDLKCPHCGAALHVDGTNMKVTCKYCGQTIYVDDEVQHIQYDNAEQAGYEFEKGRQRAQAEQKARRQQQRQQQQSTVQYNQAAAANNKKSSGCVGTCWRIFLWLCFFPIMLTIWIYKTDKIQDKRVKGGLIAALWILVIIYYIAHPSSSSEKRSSDQSTTAATTEVMEAANDADSISDEVSSESAEASAEQTSEAEPVDASVATNDAATEVPALYDRDETINALLMRFNEISSKTITPEMVSVEKNSKWMARVTFNDCYIEIDYDTYGQASDWYALRYNGTHEIVKKYFFDFTKAISSDADDELLDQCYEQLASDEYEYYRDGYIDVYGTKCLAGMGNDGFYLDQKVGK